MRPPLVNDCYYHVYNRGVIKQPIFFEEKDYVRFVHDLYEFNDASPAPKFGCSTSDDRAPVVSILAWGLMPNHFHIFLRQRCEGGISLFLKKLGGGYTNYVNEKYERSGHVFQGKYKVKMVENDAYFLHLSRYIHLNPVELVDLGKDAEADANHKKSTHDFLSQYRWSSYLDWIGTKNFPSVMDAQLVEKMRQMNGAEYSQFVIDGLDLDKRSGAQLRVSNIRRSKIGCWTPEY